VIIAPYSRPFHTKLPHRGGSFGAPTCPAATESAAYRCNRLGTKSLTPYLMTRESRSTHWCLLGSTVLKAHLIPRPCEIYTVLPLLETFSRTACKTLESDIILYLHGYLYYGVHSPLVRMTSIHFPSVSCCTCAERGHRDRHPLSIVPVNVLSPYGCNPRSPGRPRFLSRTSSVYIPEKYTVSCARFAFVDLLAVDKDCPVPALAYSPPA